MAAVELDRDRYKVKMIDETSPEIENVWVRFTCNEVADIEEAFGSSEDFQNSLETKMVSSLRTVIALATGREVRSVGAAMLPEEHGDYLLSVQIAWAVAMGMDPTQAAQTLEEGRKTVRAKQAEAKAKVARDLADAAAVVDEAESILESPSPGGNGSALGSEQGEILNSSGA